MIVERFIKVHGVEYSAEYYDDGGKCWRLWSREAIDYKGEVRLIEGDLFAASVSSIKDSKELNLCWIPVKWDLREEKNKEKEEKLSSV